MSRTRGLDADKEAILLTRVDSLNKKVIRQEGDIGIIQRSVRIWKVGEGVSGSHSSPQGVNEDEDKVL